MPYRKMGGILRGENQNIQFLTILLGMVLLQFATDLNGETYLHYLN